MKDVPAVNERLYVGRSRTTGLYYRGAKFWQWTRFPARAAFLPQSEWLALSELNAFPKNDVLLFDAPPDRWWRGRHNGQRIVGVSVKVSLQFTEWLWRPWTSKHCGAIHWLCFRTWWGAEYAPRDYHQ